MPSQWFGTRLRSGAPLRAVAIVAGLFSAALAATVAVPVSAAPTNAPPPDPDVLGDRRRSW